MKIALVQMDVVHGQPVENKKHVIEMLERALVANPDVIVLENMLWLLSEGPLLLRKMANITTRPMSTISLGT